MHAPTHTPWWSCAALLFAAGAAQAQPTPPGDVRAGAALFATHCSECHSVREGKDKKGPSLYGVLGHKAAQREGFVYSEAMRASGITWTAEPLSAYLANPPKVVPSGKMKYDGVLSEAERRDLIAYLASNGAK